MEENKCCCYEYEGDNPLCPVHNPKDGDDDKPADTSNRG